MATSKQCSTCNKSGSMYCIGCEKYFCSKDFKIHREGIFTEMEKIIEERNRLQDVINNTVQSNDQQNSVIEQNPVIEQINQWQNNIIEKVKQVAAQARQQAIQLLSSKRMRVNTEFKDFSKELADLKESEDYVEHDLKRLNQMISQFKQDLRQSTQPTTIKVHTEQSDRINWDSLIYVEERQTSTNNQQQPKQAASKIMQPDQEIERFQTKDTSCVRLTDNDRRCEKINQTGVWNCVFGTLNYSTGIHKIRLRLEKGSTHILMGICSRNKPPTGPAFYSTPTTHGWFIHGFTMTNGSGFSPGWPQVKETEILELTINCSERSLSILNEQTRAQNSMQVNITQAPFPWCLLLLFYYKDSQVSLV